MSDNFLLVDAQGNATEIKGEIKIGRSKTNDVVLSDPLASRHHATVYFEGDVLMIRDEQSVNGTIVNRTQIYEPTALNDTDMIQFGDEVFTVRAPLAESRTVMAPKQGSEKPAPKTAAKPAAEKKPAAPEADPKPAAPISGEAFTEPPKKGNNRTIMIVAIVLVVLCVCCGGGWALWNFVLSDMLASGLF